MPIYGEKHLKSSSPEPRKLQGWILLQSIVVSRSSEYVQMMTLAWHLTFLRHSQICVPMHFYRENIENSVSQNVLKTNGRNLQCMIKGIMGKSSALLNKVTPMPMYGEKHLKIYISRTKKASRQKLVIEHWRLKVIHVCSNDDPWLTFDLPTVRSNLHAYEFVWGKYWQFSFSKCIKDLWLKLTMYEQSSKHF